MSAAPETTVPSPTQLAERAQQRGFALLRDGSKWRLYRSPEEVLVPTDPDSLTRVLRGIEHHVQSGGEAAGLLRYEAGYALEPRLRPLLKEVSGSLGWFGLYADCTILENPPLLPDDPKMRIERTRLAISRDKYCSKIEEIRGLIEAGEVYQINFTTRFQFETRSSPWELFCALFRRHPVPYAAFLNLGDRQIVSLSPERFFEIERGRIAVRPMKGTAPRGRTIEEDAAAGERLGADAKNRAENVMIVDLMRNDLGRICRTGTVNTPKLFDVERYPSVWQMTSTVEGDLIGGCTVESIMRALFPSGSVTGAPKIRAMEHIAHLESSPRGAYTGAIGFFAPDRSCFNVAIRTIELDGAAGTVGVGGGITYGSSPFAEWQECQWKAAFLTKSQPEFRILETTLWDGEYRLLDAHLARMRNSAAYFDFRFDEPGIRRALADRASKFPSTPQRVRMLLAQDGTFEIEDRDYRAQQFGRVRISDRRVSSEDRFLYHKTTNRRLYDEEFSAARKAACDDALFFNERGELTEGAAHNVFLVKDGAWLTPPVSCGLLPGTCRAQILRERIDAREAVLTADDLLSADAIYLCNSVRGFYPVTLERDAAGEKSLSLNLHESAHDRVK
ncbi:MAG TPA: aminodeoxychorismate synthase component I [Verrucomicrobiae bacterium]|nr:aminodeoxychorismate synthase component I [Verrucomicrobiae bacterium]